MPMTDQGNPPDPVRARLAQLIESKQKNMAELSRAMGRNHAYLHQFLVKGSPRKLSEDDRSKLSILLSVPESDLGGPPKLQVERDELSLDKSSVPVTPSQGLGLIPLYGGVEGGPEGAVAINEPFDMVARSRMVLHVPDAYAVRVTGESMRPRIRPGEIVQVNPRHPLERDHEAVLIRQDIDGTRHAIVKTLVSWNAKSWKVRQYNPDKVYELPRAVWQEAHFVASIEPGR